MKSIRQVASLVLGSLLLLALVSSGIAIYVIFFVSAPQPANAAISSLVAQQIAAYHIYSLSIPIAIGSWFGFGLVFTFWRGNYGRSVWRKAGLDKSVYDLMVKMRGGGSRLELLRNLESPRQRNELSQLTGIDWKEVDRQIGLLLSYGLVTVYAESGSVKIYKLSQQGDLLLKLMSELSSRN